MLVCACVDIIIILFALYIQYDSQGQNLANTVSRALSITNEVDSVSCSIKHMTLYNAPLSHHNPHLISSPACCISHTPHTRSHHSYKYYNASTKSYVVHTINATGISGSKHPCGFDPKYHLDSRRSNQCCR